MKTFKRILRLIISIIPLIIRFTRIFFEIIDTISTKLIIKIFKKLSL